MLCLVVWLFFGLEFLPKKGDQSKVVIFIFLCWMMEANTSRIVTLNSVNNHIWNEKMEEFLYVKGFYLVIRYRKAN